MCEKKNDDAKMTMVFFLDFAGKTGCVMDS